MISLQIWENVKEGQRQYFDALSKDKVHLLEMVNMICFIITAVSILFLPLLTYSAYTYSGAPVETVGLLRMLSNGMGGLYGLLVAGLFFIAAFTHWPDCIFMRRRICWIFSFEHLGNTRPVWLSHKPDRKPGRWFWFNFSLDSGNRFFGIGELL